jgi:hypothetical protein
MHTAGGAQVLEVKHTTPFWGEGASDVVLVQTPECTAKLAPSIKLLEHLVIIA